MALEETAIVRPLMADQKKHPPKTGETSAETPAQRYLCVHCGHRWSADTPPPRCPECLRKTGVETVAQERRREAPVWFWPVVGGALVLLAGLGYLYWSQAAASTVGDDIAREPLSESTLRGHLRRLSVGDEDKVVSFFRVSATVTEWASKVAGRVEGPKGKAEAFLNAFAASERDGHHERWSTSTPRGTPVQSVQETFDQLRDGSNAHLYPLELAMLMAAVLRKLEVPAMLAEVYALPGAKAPPEPSGDLGYFLVMLGEGEDATFFDPVAGKVLGALSSEVVRPVNDVNVAGAVLNHLARHELVNEGESEKALRLLEQAIRLDPRSPSIRSSRADVLVVTGGAQKALEEYEVAAQLRRDPPRRNNLAAIFMELRQHDKASREVTAALEEAPDYAAGILTLAALKLAEGEREQARSYLERASELDDALPQLPLLWAQYYIETHDQERAIRKADEAVLAMPFDINTAMGAAMIYRVTSQYDKMRRQARKILELAPPAQRAMYETVLPRRLGPTALEDPDADADLTDEEIADEMADLPSSDFQLGGDSALLGDGSDSALGGGGLLGEEEETRQPGDPTLRLGEPSSYNLGGGFMLELGE